MSCPYRFRLRPPLRPSSPTTKKTSCCPVWCCPRSGTFSAVPPALPHRCLNECRPAPKRPWVTAPRRLNSHRQRSSLFSWLRLVFSWQPSWLHVWDYHACQERGLLRLKLGSQREWSLGCLRSLCSCSRLLSSVWPGNGKKKCGKNKIMIRTY